jgi:hypothetical protein
VSKTYSSGGFIGNSYTYPSGPAPITAYVTSGLVLYLDAGNSASYPGTGSTWTNLASGGNNGTLINSPTYSSANNGSLVFNGSTQYVDVANYSALNGSTQTMICWAKSASAANFGGFGCLMSKRDVYIMHPYPTNTLIDFYYFINSTYQYVRITASNINNWNMYASSWDGSTIRAYVNGSLVTSSNFTGTLATNDTGSLLVGKDDTTVDSTRYINGNISIAMQYNRALTDAEITENFNAFRVRYGI